MKEMLNFCHSTKNKRFD